MGSRYLVVLVSNHGVSGRLIMGTAGFGFTAWPPSCLPLILVLSHNLPLRVKRAQPPGGPKDKPHTHDQSKWAHTSMGPKPHRASSGQ